MSHRDLSLTPHIVNDPPSDAEKHADCIRRTGFPCTVIPPSLYDAMEANGGYEMRDLVKNKPLPTMIEGNLYLTDKQIALTQFCVEHKTPSSADMRAEINRMVTAGEPLGASHVSEIKPGVMVAGTHMSYEQALAGYAKAAPPYAKLSPSSAPRWKHGCINPHPGAQKKLFEGEDDE